MAKAKKLGFEAGIKELEEIVEKIEGGELPLDEVLKSYERGTALHKELQAMLKDGKGRIEKLMKDGSREDLDAEDEDA